MANSRHHKQSHDITQPKGQYSGVKTPVVAEKVGRGSFSDRGMVRSIFSGNAGVGASRLWHKEESTVVGAMDKSVYL